MNKMFKGAIVSGIGVALLLGGGGTLAVWNQGAASNAGTIVAGDLNLEAGKGYWTSSVANGEKIADISAYRVVPGETLTYTQPLKVTLEGDNLKATLKVTGAGKDLGFAADKGIVKVSDVTITDAQGKALPDELAKSGKVLASTTFAFSSETSGRAAVNAQYDFSGIGYLLEQVDPSKK